MSKRCLHPIVRPYFTFHLPNPPQNGHWFDSHVVIPSPAVTNAAPALPPFSINPDPSLLYLTPGLGAALHIGRAADARRTRYMLWSDAVGRDFEI